MNATVDFFVLPNFHATIGHRWSMSIQSQQHGMGYYFPNGILRRTGLIPVCPWLCPSASSWTVFYTINDDSQETRNVNVVDPVGEGSNHFVTPMCVAATFNVRLSSFIKKCQRYVLIRRNRLSSSNRVETHIVREGYVTPAQPMIEKKKTGVASFYSAQQERCRITPRRYAEGKIKPTISLLI